MRSLRLLPQHAAFVDAFLSNGRDHIAAYQTAFGADLSRKVAATNGRKLLKQAEIAAILDAVDDRARQELVVNHGLSEARVTAALMDQAFGTLADVAEWGADGRLKLKPSASLSPAGLAQIAEVSFAPGKFGPQVKIKRVDSQRALELLGRKLGMFKDKTEVLFDVTRSLAERLDAAQARLDAAGQDGANG